MKLNLEGRKKLRKNVKELLDTIPKTKKIQLPKEVLEQLLFETVVDETNNKSYKIPAWSGKFLRKLDLSQIDFSDVEWHINTVSLGARSKIERIFDDYEMFGPTHEGPLRKDFIIDYSHTNAQISFSGRDCLWINNCNFRGTRIDTGDGSFRDIDISNSDLSDTNFSLEGNLEDMGWIHDSNFENCNLHNAELPMEMFVSGGSVPSVINCNFKNSGLKIAYKGSYMLIKGETLKTLAQANLANNWIGCYLNGKLIEPPRTKEQIESEKQRILGEYAAYQAATISGILGEIRNQASDSQAPSDNPRVVGPFISPLPQEQTKTKKVQSGPYIAPLPNPNNRSGRKK